MDASAEYQFGIYSLLFHICPDSASSVHDDSHRILHPVPKNQIYRLTGLSALVPFRRIRLCLHTSNDILLIRATSISLFIDFNIASIYFFVNTRNRFPSMR